MPKQAVTVLVPSRLGEDYSVVWYRTQQWHDEIGAALKPCDWFLLMLSPQSLASEWVKRELVYALGQRQYRGRIVPILYKKWRTDQLWWMLGNFHWVDFVKSFDERCRDLLGIWGVEYARGRTVSRRRGEGG